MANLSTSITKMQEVTKGLDGVRENLKKLAKSKRTQDNLATYLSKANELWRQFSELYEEIKDNEDFPETMKEKVATAEAIYDEIGVIVTKFKSEITDGGKETNAGDQRKQETSGGGGSSGTGENENYNEKIQSVMQTLADISKKLVDESVSNREAKGSTLRVPEMNLQVFTGDIREFKAFKSGFEASIAKTRLSNIEKLHLLRSKLSGSALMEVSALYVTEENYIAAWELLTRRFDNPRAIVDTNLRALQDHPSAKARDSASILKLMQTYKCVMHNVRGATENPDFENLLFSTMIVQKMDQPCRQRFEDFYANINAAGDGDNRRLPRVDEITRFFEQEYGLYNVDMGMRPPRQPQQQARTHFTTNTPGAPGEPGKMSCYICGKDHTVTACSEFLESADRDALLKKHKICIFCACHKWSMNSTCRKKRFLKCSTCGGNHIDLLHREIVNTMFAASASENVEQVLLPTGVAKVIAEDGTVISVRIVLDQCSQASYVTEDLVQKLGWKKSRVDVKVTGVGEGRTAVKAATTFEIVLDHPKAEKKAIKVNALIVKRVTGQLPKMQSLQKIEKSLGIKFADADSVGGTVSILLGSDICPEIFCEGLRRLNGYLLQNTFFGWVVSGGTVTGKRGWVSTHVSLAEVNNLQHEDRQAVWEMIEKLKKTEDDIMKTFDVQQHSSDQQQESLDEYSLKKHIDEHSRDENGAYREPLIFLPDAPALGKSRKGAEGFLLSQERRLEHEPEKKAMVVSFMENYEAKGHMSEIMGPDQYRDDGSTYYLPHMTVFNSERVTTKARQVYHASFPSSNGVSFNNKLYKGPNLIVNLFELMLKCRLFPILLMADIEQMYRQVKLTAKDAGWLRVLWRAEKHKPIKTYQMNTVTYGLDCAGFQAICALRQCGQDNAGSEVTKKLINENFYVDDFVNGAYDIEDAKQQVREITKTLAAGGFPATKWMSNEPRALEEVLPGKRLSDYVEIDDSSEIKLLGTGYLPKEDEMFVKFKSSEKVTYTKRGMLSFTASFFDVMGVLLPVVMQLRGLLQSLWAQKLDWDDEIDTETKAKFETIVKQAPMLKNFRVPRWLGMTRCSKIELVGFSDASDNGMAAVIYSRIRTEAGFVVKFVASCGKVSPLKTKENLETKLRTIPKMELEAIWILSKLKEKLCRAFGDAVIGFRAYTDSEIAMIWTRNGEVENKFCKRMVSKIRKNISPNEIHHVDTKHNPADGASRGMTPKQFMGYSLLHEGPEWLKDEVLPFTPFKESETICNATTEKEATFIEKSSSLNRLIRAVALAMRWRKKTKKNESITMAEFADARERIVLFQQRESFSKEISKLNQGKTLSKRHWMSPLAPFVDVRGILRVGGRLSRADLSEGQKHPILIPRGHLADLVVDSTHRENGHCANSLMASIISKTFYIAAVKQTIKRIIRRCPTCVRWKATTIKPMMAELPVERVKPSSCFQAVGVDCCGPFDVKPSKIKFDRSIKVYVVAFVCLFSKALHLEVLTEMSTANLMIAVTRFTSRRGCPSQIFSDHGTNFTGLSRVIRESWEKIEKEASKRLVTQNIDWQFIPPYAPSFGGIWEAAMKSLKFFTKRYGNVSAMVYEEFVTLTCRIEGLLNSRPLYPDPSDPSNAAALTPFQVTMRNFLNNPFDLEKLHKGAVTKHWLQIQQLQKQFWDKFRQEYLQTLQKRNKWKHPARNLAINDIVLLKDASSCPADWRMGKVLKVFPDDKGNVRRVLLRTAGKESMERAVKTLVPLIKEEEKEAEATAEPRTRSNCRKTTLLTKVILTWLTLSIPMTAEAATVNPLQPGCQVLTLGKAYVQTSDFLFQLKTSINVTKNEEIISQQINEFQQFCHGLNSSKFQEQCQSLLQPLEITAVDVKKVITQETIRRERRGLAAAGVVALKYGAQVALAAGIAYQTYEIYRVENDLKEVRDRMHKVSALLLNITDTEFTVIDQQIDELRQQQMEIQVETEINAYSMGINQVIQAIKSQNENAEKMRPLASIQKHAKLNQNGEITIPDDADVIFNNNPPKRYIIQSFLHLTWKIPVVSNENFEEKIIISAPNRENEAIIFNNETLVERIIVNNNHTLWAPSKREIDAASIISDTTLQETSECLKEILNNSQPKSACPTMKVEKHQPTFFPINESAVIMLQTNSKRWKCSAKEENSH